jgi:hypothetical protein
VLLALVIVALVVVWSTGRHGPEWRLRAVDGSTLELPVPAGLSPLRTRIVELAIGQIGYQSDPPQTYCNKFSAYWYSGSSDCENANRDEQWCADFAAWAWRKAGVGFVYAYVPGELNSSSASYYEWGVRHHAWHPANSSYRPQPGDVAVYGLDTTSLVATHVGIVAGSVAGQRWPVVINGDGDESAFSIVEVRADERFALVHPNGAPLAGYVSPV